MRNLLLLASLLSITVVRSETLSLRSAQEKLLTANPDLRIQQKELEKSQAQLSEARAAYWPSLDLSGSYQALTEKQAIELPAPLPPGRRTLGDYDREEYGIDLSYPLFLGGASRQQVLARKSSLEAQHERTRSLQNQLSLRLAGLYYAWHIASASVKMQDSLVRYQEDYLNHVTALVKGGKALSSKELMARARMLGAQSDLETSRDLLDSLSRAAASLLGISSPVVFTWDSAHDSSAGTAAASRPELVYLEKSSASLTYQEKALLSQKFPSLVGMVGYRVANPGLNLGSNDYMNYGLVGVQLRWNLFDGFRNQSQRNETALQREELRIEHEKQADLFRQSEISSFNVLKRLEKSKRVAQMSWDAARTALWETQAQRDHGAASDLDLLDARVLESKYALQLNQATLQQYLAVWQWRYARGEDLKFQGD